MSNPVILVTGASGFIGNLLVKRLLDEGKYRIICMTRNPETIKNRFGDKVTIVRADATNYDELLRAMQEVDIAFYLIHSMDETKKNWKIFVNIDRKAANNFADAATKCGVKRIIYLGGLCNEKEDSFSEHMHSRNEVGEILKKSTAKVTIFNAAIILGRGSKSFDILHHLVENLPIMLSPRWILAKTQPILVSDVIEYLIKSIHELKTVDKKFDIGGPDILSYEEMMKKFAISIGRPLKIIKIPFFTSKLTSFGVDHITPVKSGVARPLIDSLKHNSIVKDDSITNIIPLKLKSFEEAIKIEHNGKTKVITRSKLGVPLTSLFSILTLLVISNILINGLIGLSFSFQLIIISFFLALSVLAIYFLSYGSRIGALFSGFIGWISFSLSIISLMYISNNVINFQFYQNEFSVTINFLVLALSSIIIILSHKLLYEKTI